MKQKAIVILGVIIVLAAALGVWQGIAADERSLAVQSEARKEILVDVGDFQARDFLGQRQIETRPYSENKLWADVSGEEYETLIQRQAAIDVLAEYVYVSGEPQSPGLRECYDRVYGSSGNMPIPDTGEWVTNTIRIVDGPTGGVVARLDCHVEITHTNVGDLVVELGDAQGATWQRLWDRAGEGVGNINETWYDVVTLADQPIKQDWMLRVRDAVVGDSGDLAFWWLKIYYEVPCDVTVTPSATSGITPSGTPPVTLPVTPSDTPSPTTTPTTFGDTQRLFLPIILKGGEPVTPTPVTDTPTPTGTPTTAPAPIPTVLVIQQGEVYWIEAENGVLKSPLKEEYGADASDCGYIMSPWQNLKQDPVDTGLSGMMYIDIDIQEGGDYYFWARGSCPDFNHDSYWFQVDDEYPKIFQVCDDAQHHGQWYWKIINSDRYVNQPHELSAGQHRIILGAREAYCKLDAIVITSLPSNDYTPDDSDNKFVDCQGVGGECHSNGALPVDTLANGSNENMPQVISYYQGSHWQESGPEYVYSFTAPQNGEMLIQLLNLTADLDIFVMGGDCSALSCIAYGDNEVRFQITQGLQYFIAIDGFSGAVGSYQIHASYLAPTPTATSVTPTLTPTPITPQPFTPTPSPSPSLTPGPIVTRVLKVDDYDENNPPEDEKVDWLRNAYDEGDADEARRGVVLLDPGQPCTLIGIRFLTANLGDPDPDMKASEQLYLRVWDADSQVVMWESESYLVEIEPNPSRSHDGVVYDVPLPPTQIDGPFYVGLSWPENSDPHNRGIRLIGESVAPSHNVSFWGSWDDRRTVPDPYIFVNGNYKVPADLTLRAVVMP